MDKVKLGKHYIGEEEPTKVIAEIADNHGGNMKVAKEMIIKAKKAGADIVKFQLHLPDKEMIPGAIEMWDGNLYEILKENLLTIDQHEELKKFCENQDIMYLCTPFCREAADLLDDIGVKAFKVGSGEMTNLPMINHIAKKGKPMIVSTGMAKWEEIKETVEVIKKENTPLIINNCTSEYPAKYEDINLKLIPRLKEEFQVPVGHSDHTIDVYTSFGAVACGARLIEKHFTLDRSQEGPDHKVSLEPQDLEVLTEGVRKIQKALGSEKAVHEKEKSVREWALHSIVSAEKIPEGSKIEKDMVTIKRPGGGIPAKEIKEVIGKITKRDISKNSLIKWEDLKK